MSDKTILEQLDEVMGGFSNNQVKFVLALPEYSSKKSCAEALGIDPNTVYNWGKKIDLAAELMQKDVIAGALAMRKKSLVKAMSKKIDGLDSKDASLRQKVATEIIEWETGKATNNVDIKSGGGKDNLPVLPSIPAELISPNMLDVYRDIRERRHWDYILKGGRGSTKSSTAAELVEYLLINNSEYHALVVRERLNTLRDSAYSELEWAAGKLGIADLFVFRKSPLMITYKPTGQNIYFRGANDPLKIRGIKPKFGKIAILWIEEAQRLGGEKVIRDVVQSGLRGEESLGAANQSDVSISITTYNPPPSESNWINKWAREQDGKDGVYIHHSTYLDVPPEWLGKRFLNEAEYLKEKNEKAYNHEYLGDVTGTGGMVFENVEIREITDEEVAQFDRVYHGLDWGYFPHPFSYGKMHYDAARETIYIFGEYYCYRKSNEDTFEKIQEHGYNVGELIVADSAEPKSIADYNKYGAKIRGAEKGAGSVKYSMKWLQSRKAIVIDKKRAPLHAEQFLYYEFEIAKDGTFIEEYPDENDDAIDDVRYALNKVWRRAGR